MVYVNNYFTYTVLFSSIIPRFSLTTYLSNMSVKITFGLAIFILPVTKGGTLIDVNVVIKFLVYPLIIQFYFQALQLVIIIR